jgi:UDPglucose 6-dehydrogenase
VVAGAAVPVHVEDQGVGMNITVIGTGYVGLVTGACFSEFGVQVTCVDKVDDKIAALKRGEIPIYEPGLEDIVARNVRSGRLAFTSDTSEAIDQALVIFIAVGTPAAEDGSTDLAYVETVAREIGERIDSYKVIVTKSTVPVGTSDKVRVWIQEELDRRGAKVRFSVASNPEFLREGAAIGDFMRPDRVVIGTDAGDDTAIAIIKDLYRPLYLNETPFVETDIHTAELSKYAANAFLATKISFINEVSILCEAVGGNVQAIARAMGLDQRIGKKFLHAGPGFGGSCFPKDTLSAAHFARELGHEFSIVEATIRVNERQRHRMIDKIESALDGDVEGRSIAILGLSFKPETDDIREAPAIAIARGLLDRGATIRAYDPAAMAEAGRQVPELILCKNAYEALTDADVMVIVTEWNEFRMLDLDRVKSVMAEPRMVDLRNIYDRRRMVEAGFQYWSVGR